MKNALIIHDSDPTKTRRKREFAWYPWLEGQLELKDHKVFLQEMPLAWKPNTELYWDFLKEKFNYNSESLLIGHGSGATALLGILEKIPPIRKVNKVVLVAPLLTSSKKDEQGLFKKEFDWDNIKEKANKFYILYSEDDDGVDVEKLKDAANKLQAEIFKFEDRGHFEDGEILELMDII